MQTAAYSSDGAHAPDERAGNAGRYVDGRTLDDFMATLDHMDPVARVWFDGQLLAMNQGRPNAFDGRSENLFEVWSASDAGKAAYEVARRIRNKFEDDLIDVADELTAARDLLEASRMATAGVEDRAERNALAAVITEAQDRLTNVRGMVESLRSKQGGAE